VIKYSYVMSLDNLFRRSALIDYGRCDENDAKKPLFCLEFFHWSG